MRLVSEIDQACGYLKHDPESVDLSEMRLLLRRAQYALECFDYFLHGTSCHLELHADEDGYLSHRATLTADLSPEERSRLLYLMSEED